MKALKIRAPIRQHFFEPAIGQVRCDQPFGYVGQADSVYSGIEHVHGAVEDELPFDFDGEGLAILVEFPRVNGAGWPVPDIDGRTLELTQNRTLASEVKFMNFYPFNDIETISPCPLPFIAGDQAHSREFSEDAYQRAAEPKELYWIKGANHVDLYDRVNVIPWDKLTSFFTQHLSA